VTYVTTPPGRDDPVFALVNPVFYHTGLIGPPLSAQVFLIGPDQKLVIFLGVVADLQVDVVVLHRGSAAKGLSPV